MVKRLEDGEAAVGYTFAEHFPGQSFDRWNIEVSERNAENIIRTVGRASSIRVDKFIKDLADM